MAACTVEEFQSQVLYVYMFTDYVYYGRSDVSDLLHQLTLVQ
jgi:hypothetical protein